MVRLKDLVGDTVKDRCEKAHLTPFEEEVLGIARTTGMHTPL